jgi:hypothetical protein
MRSERIPDLHQRRRVVWASSSRSRSLLMAASWPSTIVVTTVRFLRGRGERGFALLTERWTALKHTALSPSRIGDLVRAAHVLTLFEHHRIH